MEQLVVDQLVVDQLVVDQLVGQLVVDQLVDQQFTDLGSQEGLGQVVSLDIAVESGKTQLF